MSPLMRYLTKINLRRSNRSRLVGDGFWTRGVVRYQDV